MQPARAPRTCEDALARTSADPHQPPWQCGRPNLSAPNRYVAVDVTPSAWLNPSRCRFGESDEAPLRRQTLPGKIRGAAASTAWPQTAPLSHPAWRNLLRLALLSARRSFRVSRGR